MFGQRLRLARKRAGLSMCDLADRLNPRVTAQAISKYEAGKMLPSSSVLIGLGKALHVSLDFLLGAQVEALNEVELRQHSRASARDRARAEAAVMDSLERYLATEHILDMESGVECTEGQRCDSVASEPQIDGRADDLRRIWNLGLGPIPSLCQLLEDKGIKVVEADLPNSINGLSCHGLRDGKIVAEAVVVSSRVNVERKRFMLAHEIAHRIIRCTGNPAIGPAQAMNRFAGAFLIPGLCLREEVGTKRRRVTYYEIVRLKHLFGVSATVLLMRLGQVGILSEESLQHAFRTYARSWRKSEPDPIKSDHGFAAFEKPCRFKRLVLRAVGEALISPMRAGVLLNEPLESIEQQVSPNTT